MEIPLIVYEKMYQYDTIAGWKRVWETICQMAYEKTGVCEKIITKPGYMRVNGVENLKCSEAEHSRVYLNKENSNDYSISLDVLWKYYSNQYGSQMPHVIPELKEIHVPRILFDTIGVRAWFNYSFPNCRIFFWDE